MSHAKLKKDPNKNRKAKRDRQRRLAEEQKRSGSTPAKPPQSRSRESLEDDRLHAKLRALDSHSGLRNGLRKVAASRDDMWAGIPMPLDDEVLVIEPKYPHAAELMAIGARTEEQVQAGEREAQGKIRGAFFSTHKRSIIVIFERPDGRVDWGVNRPPHPLLMALKTLGCSTAWGIEQEAKALQLLAGLITHHQFKQYLLTGSFLERSPRSGVTYMFRKLRPTVAVHTGKTGKVEIMCALCAHPIGYYKGSWAGVMCPSDEVVAHLQMMRADEARFWRTSNQHEAIAPQAGVY